MMKLWHVIASFSTAVLGLLNGILRLARFDGDIWDIVLGIGWLVIGALWLWIAAAMLKLFNKIKNEAVEEDETND